MLTKLHKPPNRPLMPDPEAQAFAIASGRIVRQLRRAQGVTQEALAKRIGISPQQLQKYERGTDRLSLYRSWQIAQALQVTPAMLIPLPSFDATPMHIHKRIVRVMRWSNS